MLDVPHRSGSAVDDGIDALDLARRAAASDVGPTTLDLLDAAVDDLASSYAATSPEVLLDLARAHLRYLAALLDGRSTLAQHRRLLVAGGWLSLLAATLHVDLQQQTAATARLRTADTLAREAEHAEIRAWRLETDVWRMITLGEYGEAVTLAQAAQRLVPAPSSARIQATAQEGRAWARLGEVRATTRVVASATSYNRDDAVVGVGDPAAVDYAREVIARLGPAMPTAADPAVSRWHGSTSLSRCCGGTRSTRPATRRWRPSPPATSPPSNRWRAREVIDSAERLGTHVVAQVDDAYRAMIGQDA